MKQKKRLFLCVIFISLFLCIYFFRARNEKSALSTLVPSTRPSWTYVVQQKDGYTTYFVTQDSTIYKFFYNKQLLKANRVVLDPWYYKAVLTDFKALDENGDPFTLCDESCVITVYDKYIEIDGITYWTTEKPNMVEWFDIYWKNNTEGHRIIGAVPEEKR